jgi:hypothetical protein
MKQLMAKADDTDVRSSVQRNNLAPGTRLDNVVGSDSSSHSTLSTISSSPPAFTNMTASILPKNASPFQDHVGLSR